MEFQDLERFDMHCHLDFAGNEVQVAEEALHDGTGLYSVTVTPTGYRKAQAALSPYKNVRVGLGLHPWWLADGRCGDADVRQFETYIAQTNYVGEVGMDFTKRCAGSEQLQQRAFDRVIAACSADGGNLISLHAARAEDAVLDVLQHHNCTQANTCILHWFSGSSDQLQRAIKLGCYFSVSTRMMASKRGRAYVQAIPVERLLLETDLPSEPVDEFAYADLKAQLQQTADQLTKMLGGEAAVRIARAGADLLTAR